MAPPDHQPDTGPTVSIEHPYLMFLGDAADDLAAKTARGIVHWRPDWCKGQLSLDGCKTTLGLPEMSLEDAAAAGCRTLVVGIANRGGVIPDAWIDTLVEALILGLDVASGLHARLVDLPDVSAAAARHGRQLFDVRHPAREFDVASGVKRPGRRLLTVGSDCSVGKMFTVLALERELKGRGVDADFRATGQTGIFIAGDGISVDAVIADFISGAVEWLSPANGPDHWDLVEGQGSLFHPSFAGVTMGLLHGAQPDALVLCHEPTRGHMRGVPHLGLPDLKDCIDAHVAAARLTNPAATCIGVAVNTAALTPDEGAACVAEIGARLGLPCVDPVRDGAAPLADALA